MDHDTSQDAKQRLVETRFRQRVRMWDDLYDRTDASGLIYQYRLRQAVHWIEQLPLRGDATILEIGCGPGRTTAAIAAVGHRVHASDATPEMVERARDNLRAAGAANVTLDVQDAHALTYRDEAFDVVVALGVVPWLHSPQLALREMARVLVSGGYLIASADNRRRLPYLIDPRHNAALAPLREALKTLLRRAGAGRGGTVRATMHTLREFDDLLRSAGLARERAVAFGFGPFTIMGRRVVGDDLSARVHTRLQRWADGPLPSLRTVANQFLVLARKR
jgi:ubiquinone/menaquinone biosynthesis C-methylase UbiE